MPTRRTLAGLAAGCGLLAARAVAQEPAQAFVVTYLEVSAAGSSAARDLLRAYAAASRPGAVRFDALERTDQPHHFAIVETWAGPQALADHAAARPAQAFRAGLAPLLSAPYDERPHLALSVGPVAAIATDALVAVTHVDIVPTRRDEGVAAVRQLAEASRFTPGNLRYDALIQASRPNHLTLVEAWAGDAAMEAHRTAPHVLRFRAGLLPMSGSLFDQRLYRALA